MSMLYTFIFAGISLYLIYWTARSIYRVYFHPLSAFPGPRTAAISQAWQASVMKSRVPEAEMAQYHREYNTRALRIGPNELHLTYPSLYRLLYSQTHPFPKDPIFYSNFVTIPHTLPSELDYDAHRFKRRLVNPLFSRTGVDKLTPVFQAKLQYASAKVGRLYEEGIKTINVSDFYRCLTLDFISESAFGFSLNQLDEKAKGFRTDYLESFDKGVEGFRSLQFSAAFRYVAKVMPLRLVGMFDQSIRKVCDLDDTAHEAVRRYLGNKESAPKNHPVVFDYLVGKLEEKDLPKEAQIFIVAGADTTAFVLSRAMHYILSYKVVEEKLVRALDRAREGSDHWPLRMDDLEHVEYLNAVVKESLRLGMPIADMLPRVVPPAPSPALVIDGKPVPVGTVVGIGAYSMHYDTSIWGEDAHLFKPERWLAGDNESRAHLDSYLVTFSKGARSCVARNLATAEITMTLAWMFSIWRMTLRTKEPKISDHFFYKIDAPGVLVDFEPRRRNEV